MMQYPLQLVEAKAGDTLCDATEDKRETCVNTVYDSSVLYEF